MDSGLGEFFQQIPPILIIMFCGSGLLLVAAVALMVRARARKANAALAAAGPSPVTSAAQQAEELPDLDALVAVEAPAQPQRKGTFTVLLVDGGEVEAVEVMTILRDVADGGLIIQIGDKSYRNPPALADAEFKRRFNMTVRDLYDSISRQSLSTAPAPAALASDVPLALDELADDAMAEGNLETPSVDPVQPAGALAGDRPPANQLPPSASAVNIAAEPVPGDLPKFKLPDTIELPRRGRRRPPAEPVPEINIAEAIEEFLQYKLRSAPQFAGHRLHVRPAVGGGVKIEVDGQFYDSVGEVADAEVRAYLQAVIEEWQSRQ
ncbi:MAG: hypothetical protein SNJ59_02075 [Aggregatilineales bacterium]